MSIKLVRIWFKYAKVSRCSFNCVRCHNFVIDLPHWIEKSESHDGRLSGERVKKYPLLVVSDHPGGGCTLSLMISTGSAKFLLPSSGSCITQRIMPDVIYVDHGARLDPIVVGELDRGGTINLITPRSLPRNAAAHVVTGFLIEVERVNLDELRKKYPEAFNKSYNQISGLRIERLIAKVNRQSQGWLPIRRKP
jgi:hypothetical protein